MVNKETSMWVDDVFKVMNQATMKYSGMSLQFRQKVKVRMEEEWLDDLLLFKDEYDLVF